MAMGVVVLLLIKWPNFAIKCDFAANLGAMSEEQASSQRRRGESRGDRAQQTRRSTPQRSAKGSRVDHYGEEGC